MPHQFEQIRPGTSSLALRLRSFGAVTLNEERPGGGSAWIERRSAQSICIRVRPWWWTTGGGRWNKPPAGHPLTLGVGVSLIGNPTGRRSHGSLTIGATGLRGQAVLTLVPDPAGQANVQFASATRAAGATALFRGTNLGQPAGAGTATLSVTGGFTFVGSGTADMTNKGILPWALADASASGYGTSFATADTASGLVRPLRATEYVTTLVAAQNVNLSTVESTASSIAESVTT